MNTFIVKGSPPPVSTSGKDILDVNASDLLNILLHGSPADGELNDEFLSDLNNDSGWEIGNSSGNANSSGTSGGGSSKPMTEEEQKIASALQERIAINVNRLGNHALNTVEIAKECKRIMIAYNIGQRLFARFVMNQVVKVRSTL